MVRRLSHEEIIQLSAEGVIQERILPGGTCFIPSHGHLSLPVSKESVRFASTLGEIHASFNTTASGAKLLGVSFGGVMLLHDRLRLDVCYYGDDENDFLSHLSSHIKHTLSICHHQKVSIIIRHPSAMSKQKMGEMFIEYFGVRPALSEIEDMKGRGINTKIFGIISLEI